MDIIKSYCLSICLHTLIFLFLFLVLFWIIILARIWCKIEYQGCLCNAQVVLYNAPCFKIQILYNISLIYFEFFFFFWFLFLVLSGICVMYFSFGKVLIQNWISELSLPCTCCSYKEKLKLCFKIHVKS